MRFMVSSEYFKGYIEIAMPGLEGQKSKIVKTGNLDDLDQLLVWLEIVVLNCGGNAQER